MTFTDTEHSSLGSLAIKIKRFSNKRNGTFKFSECVREREGERGREREGECVCH